MTQHHKKLIEVALPLDAINDASAYDKMPGIGPHPKGIHHWWARLPLPCARVILFASLVDDPSSDPAFADKSESEQDKERERLFGIIRSMLQKKIHNHPEVFEAAQEEIARSCKGRLPPVLDPFNGGGSIPVEAQRLGLKAYGSDLNPIAVLITKALIEIVPKFANRAPVNPEMRDNKLAKQEWSRAHGLANDVRYYGKWMLEEARKRIGHLYPKVKTPNGHNNNEATVIAWIWARTVECPNPACKAQMPLVRSFWLSTKKNKKAWIEPVINRVEKTVQFEVKTGEGAPPDPPKTGRGTNFRCLVCKEPADDQHIKDEGIAKKFGVQLLAIVADGGRGRLYLSPTSDQEVISAAAQPEWEPTEDLPYNPRAIYCPLYGLQKFSDLFTSRQLVALTTLVDLVKEVRERVLNDAKLSSDWKTQADQSLYQGGDGPIAYADTIATFLSFAIDRLADFNCALSTWKPSGEQQMHLFSRQAIPMVWDFAEANVFADKAICWSNAVEITADAIETIIVKVKSLGEVNQLDATSALPYISSSLISTDPPYYDNVPYADLSDFFYVWLRRSLKGIYPDLFSTMLVPSKPELIAAPEKFDNNKEAAREHFESGFRKAFTLLKDKLDPRFPMTVYYAFKQSDEEEDDSSIKSSKTPITLTTGWETMLEALISTGFQITGTWPVRASQAWRMRSMGSNALASYIVLACRPRAEKAPMATRREFISALRRELPAALKKLQHGNIAPVDFAQAAIGPGMAVFSRYSKVIEPDGDAMRVRKALQLINEELDAYFTEQEGELDSDTRFCIAWFEQRGMEQGPFGEADVLARAKNTAVEGLVRAGVLEARAGKVRLLKREEYPEDWNPAEDRKLIVWECTQHLIRALQKGGETAAARLANQLGGGRSEEARALAYRLYAICERKGWAQEALAYNTMVASWSDVQTKTASMTTISEQSTFGFE